MPYIGNNHIAGDHTNNFKVLDDISSFTATFDGSASSVVDTTNNTIRVVEHRFIQGQRVTYTNGGGGNIGGLTSGTAYFVIFDSASTIKLATSASNATNSTSINLSAVGSGSSHTLNAAFDGVNTKFKLTHGSGTGVRLNNATQINVAINNVVQRPNLDPNNFTDGFALEDNHKIVFQTAPTSEDIFWGSIISNSLPTFDISDHKVDTFTGDGSTTEFNLSHTPANNESLMVSINGVLQHPSDGHNARSYTLIANVVQFTAAPAVGDEIQVRHMGFAGATTGDVSGFYGRTGNVVLTANDHITTGDITARNINASGILTASSASFGGNVSIGGTLSYEDVTNIDSVGIVTAREGIFLPDNKKIELGNVSGSGDLQLYHDGGHSRIVDNGTGNLVVQTDGFRLRSTDQSEVLMMASKNNSVDLYYDNDKKFETSAKGIQVGTGVTFETNGQGTFSGIVTSRGYEVSYADGAVSHDYFKAGRIRIFDNGSHCHFRFGDHPSYAQHQRYSSSEVVRTNNWYLQNTAATRYAITWINNDGPVNLYYSKGYAPDYSIKLSTTPIGVTVGSGVTIETNGQATFAGITTFSDLDVDGHTNLDNVSVAGVSTFASSIHVADSIIHQGDTDTKIEFSTNDIRTTVANKLRIHHAANGLNYFNGNNISQATSTHTKLAGSDYVHRFRDEEGDDTLVQFFNTNVKNSVIEWNDYGSTTAAGNLIFKGVSGGSGLEHARFTGSGNFNLLRDLDVDGNVSIAGVTTMSSTLNLESGVKINTSSDSGATRLFNIAHATSSSPLVRIANTYASGRTVTIEYQNTQSRFTQGIQQGSPHGFITHSINPRPISFWNSSTERLRVESSGNISIFKDLDVDGHTNLDNVSIAGVTTSTGNIYADNYFANSGLTLNNNGNPSVNITSTSTTGSSRIHFGDPDSTSVGKIYYVHNGDYMQFSTAYNERLRIHSNGFMSLGSSSAPTKFGIRGNSATTDATMQIVGNGVSTLLLGQDSDGGVIRGQGGNSVLKFKTGGGGDTAAASGGTEVFRLRGSNFLIGTTASRAIASTHTSRFQIEGTGTDTSSAHIIFNSNSPTGAFLFLGKSRGTSNASNNRAINGDQLGTIAFHGADGTDIQSEGAYIRAQVDGTSGSNDMPGRLVFATTADGSSSATERLRIDSSGRLLVNTTTTYTSNQIMIVKGASPTGGGNRPYDGQLAIESTETSGAINTGGVLAFIGHDGGTSRGFGSIRNLKEDGTSGNYGTYMSFETRANGSAPAEKVRIDSSGRLGINQSTPVSRLHISEAGSNTITIQLTNATTGHTAGTDGMTMGYSTNSSAGFINVCESSAFTIKTGGTAVANERFRITSTGNVGISSAVPVERLDVNGSINAGEENSAFAQIRNEVGTNIQSFKHYFTVNKSSVTGNATNRTIISLNIDSNFHQAVFEVTYGCRLQGAGDTNTRPSKIIFGVNRFAGNNTVSVNKKVIEQDSSAASHADVNIVSVSGTNYIIRVEFSSSINVSSFAGGWIEGSCVASSFTVVDYYYGVRR